MPARDARVLGMADAGATVGAAGREAGAVGAGVPNGSWRTGRSPAPPASAPTRRGRPPPLPAVP